MSNENYNDEIDLNQLLKIIRRGSKSFLKSIVAVVLFYRKKWILFTILLVLGVGIGFFIDYYKQSSDEYLQEIIIEPKYNSTKYIYDFIWQFEDNIEDEEFLKKLKIDLKSIDNLKEIVINPVVKGTDVLDNLQERYENREFFKDLMNAYDDDLIEDERFRNFYKHHRLTFSFKNKKDENTKITAAVIQYLTSNEYYIKKSDFTLQQTKSSLEQNKVTLKFVNEYLDNLSKTPPKTETGVVVMQNNKDTPVMTVASLLQQKESLMEIINEQERIVTLDQDVLAIVDYGDIISVKKKLVSRKLFIIPLLFCGLVSFWYFVIYLSRSITSFIKEE